MRCFRDGLDKPKIIRTIEQPIPRSFANGFDRPVAASAVWTPKIYNPVWWSDPSLLGLADGARIDSLLDLSGNANHRVKVTDATRPYYEAAEQNGLGAGRLSQATSTRLLWSTPVVQAQPFTYFIVISNTGISAVNAEYLTGTLGTSYIRQHTATYSIEMGAGSILSAAETQTFGFKVYGFIANGANSEIWCNGTQVATGDIGAGSFTFSMFGNRSDDGTKGWDGMWGDDFLVASVLSTAQMQRASAKLKQKWGIAA
jgi:hypothetical protein